MNIEEAHKEFYEKKGDQIDLKETYYRGDFPDSIEIIFCYSVTGLFFPDAWN